MLLLDSNTCNAEKTRRVLCAALLEGQRLPVRAAPVEHARQLHKHRLMGGHLLGCDDVLQGDEEGEEAEAEPAAPMAAPAGGPKKMRSENPEFQNQQHERCVVFLSVSFWRVRKFHTTLAARGRCAARTPSFRTSGTHGLHPTDVRRELARTLLLSRPEWTHAHRPHPPRQARCTVCRHLKTAAASGWALALRLHGSVPPVCWRVPSCHSFILGFFKG